MAPPTHLLCLSTLFLRCSLRCSSALARSASTSRRCCSALTWVVGKEGKFSILNFEQIFEVENKEITGS